MANRQPTTRACTPHRISVRVSAEMIECIDRVVRMHSRNGIEPDASEVLRAAIGLGLAQLENADAVPVA